MNPAQEPATLACVLAALVLTTVPAAAAGAKEYAAALQRREGLIAYWPLRGDLNAAAGNLQLRPVKGSVSAGEGPFGEPAVDLSGGRPLLIDPAPAFDGPQFSVELIFRITRAQGGAPCLFAIRGPNGTRFSLHYRLDSSRLVIWNGSAVSYLDTDETLAPNEWYHVALHFAGDKTAVWLNGKACSWAGAPATVSRAAGLPFIVGASTPDGFESADILVSHLALTTTPLTGNELARQMKAAGWGGKLARTLNWRTSPVSILASQIGYHPRNVKHVYLRSLYEHPPKGVVGRDFSVVRAGTDQVVYRGKVQPWGRKWGSYWWVLDFTPLRAPGDYCVKTGSLVSSVFKVEDDVFRKTDLGVIALDQLEHRIHKGAEDTRAGLKGLYTKPGVRIYMDCGSPYAELEPVGTCVYALMDLYEKLGDRFSATDRKRMLDLAVLGADYVAACQRQSDDPLKDGMFCHSLLVNSKDTWAGSIFTYLDAAYGMALMARAAQFFRQSDPGRAARYLEVSKRAWRLCVRRPYHTDDDFAFPQGCHAYFWNAPEGIQDTFGRCIYNIKDKNWKRPKTLRTRDRLPFIQGSALLYEITGEKQYLEKAAEFADAVMARQFTDWQHPIEGCYGNFYEFEGDDNSFFIEFAQGGHWWEGNVEACNLEGFERLLRLAPADPRAAAWLNTLRTYAYHYARAATATNPLGISPVACYRDPEHGGLKYFQNTLMGSSCLHGFSTKNFMELGAFLGDSRFQLNAMAGVSFIAGLNPGIPNAYKESAWQARSLIQGVGRSWFGPVGDLAETARGSVPNGFTAGPQFWLPTFTNFIADEEDRPAGMINAGGGLQFNEGWILHSHAYVQGVAHLEAPFTARIVTEDAGIGVPAEVQVVIKESAPPCTQHRMEYRTAPDGSLTLTDLPAPAAGRLTATYQGRTLARDIAVVSGGEHLFTVDFSRSVEMALSAPELLAAGKPAEAAVSLRNTGRAPVELEIILSAAGVALGRDRLKVSLPPGARTVEKVPFTAGGKVTPYLIRAYIRGGAPPQEAIAEGRVGG